MAKLNPNVLVGAIASVIGMRTNFKDLRNNGTLLLQQRVAIVGQGATDAVYSLEKRTITSAAGAANIYGQGSPIHLAALQLLPANGDGVGQVPVTVYPLLDAENGVAATGSITPTGSQTVAAQYRVKVNGTYSEYFTIAAGATIAQVVANIATAINAVLRMPVKAVANSTVVNLTAKWKGLSSNGIKVSVEGPISAGTDFAVTQMSGGLVNPSVQPALDKFGTVWETLIVNCLNPSDVDALNAFSVFGEGRWGEQIHCPLVTVSGETESNVNTALTIPNSRKSDRVNVKIPLPGSPNLPLEIAARAVARIAVLASTDPASDYGQLELSGLVAGNDAVQWQYNDRNLAVKSGLSTTEVKDDVPVIGDVVTFYHPSDEEVPAYRYLCDIVKLQNILFNIRVEFAKPEWRGAPLIPDNQTTVNPNARRPKDARAKIASIIDNIALNAIISEPEYSKKNTFAAISSENPKRLDIETTVKLSGNSNVIGVGLNFGFYFGTNTISG